MKKINYKVGYYIEDLDDNMQPLPNLEFERECMVESQSVKTIVHEKWAPIEEWYINPEAISKLSLLEKKSDHSED